MNKMNYYLSLSVFLASTAAQTAFSIDISATGNEDPVMRICIEGETPERTDYALSEQIDACTSLITGNADEKPLVLFYRAMHLRDAKKWADALDDLNKLTELTPNIPSVWYYRATVSHHLQGPSQYAIDDVSQAISLTEHTTPRPYYLLTRALISIELALHEGDVSAAFLEHLETADTDLVTFLARTAGEKDKLHEKARIFSLDLREKIAQLLAETAN